MTRRNTETELGLRIGSATSSDRDGAETLRFHDRRQAGRELGGRLRERQRSDELPNPVVLALPRGGVPVADEVAQALHASLDVLVVRKIGAPYQPELGAGALAVGGPPVFDQELLRRLRLSEADLATVVERERQEANRRAELYREGRGELDLTGCSAVVVDDGLATGSTARAALRAARQLEPERLLLAVPVGAPEVVQMMEREADEVICLRRPSLFGAVGFWYEDFAQLSDEDVLEPLRHR